MNKITGQYNFKDQAFTCDTFGNELTFENPDWSIFLLGDIYSHNTVQVSLLLNSSNYNFNDLNGEFCVIAYQKVKKELFIVADHLGLEEIFYCSDDQQFIFSTDYTKLTGIAKPKDINKTWIGNYLAIKTGNQKHTLYSQIKRLQHGHYVKINKTGVEEIKYRFPERIKKQNISIDEAIKQFDQLLNRAVKSRIGKFNNVGCELSGGLDSSGVTALASRYTANLNTFSHSLQDTSAIYPFVNENEHIEKVNARINNTNQHYSYAHDKGFIDSMFRLSDISGMPCDSRIAAVSDEILELAEQQNIDCMLSGFGGDELITSQASSVQIQLLRQLRFRKVFSLQSNAKKLNLKRWFHLCLLAYAPGIMNFYYKHININGMITRFKKMPLKQQAIRHFGLMQLVHDKIPDLKINFAKKQIAQFDNPNFADRVNATKKMGRTYGFEYRFPLLDKDLMDFYVSVPDEYKYRQNIGRYLYRRTIEKYLPKEIAWRNDKAGATVPNIMIRYMNDYKAINNLLNSFEQANIGNDIFDYAKFRELQTYIKTHATGKAYKAVHGDLLNYISLLKFMHDYQMEIK